MPELHPLQHGLTLAVLSRSLYRKSIVTGIAQLACMVSFNLNATYFRNNIARVDSMIALPMIDANHLLMALSGGLILLIILLLMFRMTKTCAIALVTINAVTAFGLVGYLTVIKNCLTDPSPPSRFNTIDMPILLLMTVTSLTSLAYLMFTWNDHRKSIASVPSGKSNC